MRRVATIFAIALGTAIGAAVGVGIAVGAGTARDAPPLARPHTLAKVECAKCHTGDSKVAVERDACQTCHSPSEHASTRGPHRALVARGELTCASCHPAHEGAQGVTFEGGAFVRWGAGSERSGYLAGGAIARGRPKTVALVSLASCTRCHDPLRASDPVAACVSSDVREGRVPSTTTVSGCFDEHRTLNADPTRWARSEAAREVAQTTPWVRASSERPPPWMPVAGSVAFALAFGGGLEISRRRRRAAAAPQLLALPPPAKKKLPMIDTSTCLGCNACVDACPFDVLIVRDYVAVVARPEECCGVVLCEQVCPNGSLRIAEGNATEDRPAIKESLESEDVPGMFFAGDLTGLPLIRNAIAQGTAAVDAVAKSLPKGSRISSEDGHDVVVIGAGPAGISAALAAQTAGLSCVVLEQASIAASVRSFPRDKIVRDAIGTPLASELWVGEGSKDEILQRWTRVVRTRRLDVREGHRVVAIERRDDRFVVAMQTASGQQTITGSRVVVAIGRRGTPRKLDVAVDSAVENRVHYALSDAASFARKRVVVVGLGDTAMEAAIALARQPDTSVTIVYRGAAFSRGKARNIGEVKDLVARGRIRILFETVPVEMTQAGVVVRGEGRQRTVPADALFVLIGGLPAWDLLIKAGVRRP